MDFINSQNNILLPFTTISITTIIINIINNIIIIIRNNFYILVMITIFHATVRRNILVTNLVAIFMSIRLKTLLKFSIKIVVFKIVYLLERKCFEKLLDLSILHQVFDHQFFEFLLVLVKSKLVIKRTVFLLFFFYDLV